MNIKKIKFPESHLAVIQMVKTIARNAAIDELQNKSNPYGRHKTDYPDDELMGDPKQAEPHQDMERSERIESVRQAMTKLVPMDREILQLFYFEDLSLEDIVKKLNIPLGTAKRRLKVGRDRLEFILKGLNPYGVGQDRVGT